jgi:hypothetical protein
VYGVYGAVLGLFAVAIALDTESTVRTKIGEELALVLIPLGVFLLAAVPLQRQSRSRPVLVCAALTAAAVAVLFSMVTFGVGLPVSACLIAVAIADLVRARHLRTRAILPPSRDS